MTEPMKTAEDYLYDSYVKNNGLENSPEYILKAMDEYTAQQVAAERERIKDTLNKVQGSWSYQQVIDLIDSL